MQISVIIVNYNAGQYIVHCLASLEAQLTGIDYEICVVDNASTDGSVGLVEQQFPRVQIVLNEYNAGFSAGINAGLRRTTGEYVIWVNPDSLFLNNGVEAMLRFMRTYPEAGVLGPQIINNNGSIQLSCRSFPSYHTALFNRYSLLTQLFPHNRYSNQYLQTGWDHASPREVDWVSGACLLHRREVVEQLGGLDERFFMYSEDVDFCLRARQHDWKIYYVPALKVLHHIGGSSRQIPYRMVVERHRSMWLYYAKHFSRNPLKDIAVGAGIWGRCGVMLMRERLKLNSLDRITQLHLP